MSKPDRRTLELQAQAHAAAAAALALPSSSMQDTAFAAASTVADLARRRARKAAVATDPVLILPANATKTELRAARQRRSVRRGEDVYLPSWTEATVGLPNALLRSALFSASSQDGGWLANVELAAQGDVSLWFTGQALCGYDRRVFAACLDHYRDDRPLSPGGSASWLRVSFYQFAQLLGLAYGASVHRALRASLLRLNSANLRVRVNRLDVPLPRLIEVAFDDGYSGEGTADVQLLGSDLIAFRVLEPVAALFGPVDWTAVNKPALDYKGLTAWVASFYCTHAKPQPLPVSHLYDLSGITCDQYEFRRMLTAALTRLQGDDTPPELRIARFSVTKRVVWVCLAKWSAAKRLPPDGSLPPELAQSLLDLAAA